MPETECITRQPQFNHFARYSFAHNSQCYPWLDIAKNNGGEESVSLSPSVLSQFRGSNFTTNRPFLDDSLRNILKLYAMHVRDNADCAENLFVSGGLQQYIIKTKSTEAGQGQPRKKYGSEVTTFHDLPDSLQLHIFSYLSAADLSRIAPVCSHWLLLTSDNILWQKRLHADLSTWSIIGHSSNPDIYDECKSDWSAKEIYLKCSPVVTQCVREQNIGFHSLSQLVRSFWPKKTPRIAMFGPGLESSTSGIARKILEGQSELFKAVGMFPGQFGGVGSGFTIKMKSTTFNLVTLYTSSKHERQNISHNQRANVNRMLVHSNRDNTEENNAVPIFDVTPAIKDLCRTIDGFIFVVDASLEEKEALHSAQSELYSIINDQWTQHAAPVLVLSCICTEGSRQHACIDVVRQTSLSRFNRPWQVHDCDIETMSGIEAGVEWLVERAQRK